MRAWLGSENEFTFLWDRNLKYFAEKYGKPLGAIITFMHKELKSIVDDKIIITRFFPIIEEVIKSYS